MTTNREVTTTAPRLGRYEIDARGSTVTFRTRHVFGLAPVRGTFAVRGGTIDVAEPITNSSVHVEIDAASFHTGNPMRDKTVRSAAYLDTDRYPAMTFTSGTFDGSTLAGTLTVRHVSRPVRLAVEQPTVGPGGFTARATTRIDRTEFGVTAGRGMTGRYLTITAEVRCVRR